MPDFAAGAAPGSATRPFIMLPEGVGRLFSINGMNYGPFPEHYEPVESPIDSNPLHPKVSINIPMYPRMRPTRSSGTASATRFITSTRSSSC